MEHCPGATDHGRVGKLIQILRKKENSAFWKFCTILKDSGNELWAKKLKETAEERLALPNTPSGEAFCVHIYSLHYVHHYTQYCH